MFASDYNGVVTRYVSIFFLLLLLSPFAVSFLSLAMIVVAGKARPGGRKKKKKEIE